MTNTAIWTDLADKYRVRHYIDSCGLNSILVGLYGVWKDANDIDFSILPNSFVLKTNHGCGEIMLVSDKSDLDIAEVRNYFNSQISKPYGELEAGMHYTRIKPCIIAEEILVNDSVSCKYSRSIIDYKLWCFNGKVYYTLVCSNRDKKGLDLLLYDRDWNPHSEFINSTSHYRTGRVMPMPINYNKMISIAETLAKPFPCVRVDLYNIGGRIYFGEMTFTSLGGLMNYFTPDFLDMAGDLIDLKYNSPSLNSNNL